MIRDKTEYYRNLLLRAMFALKDTPGIAEADLADEIDAELGSEGPVSTTWSLGVHAAIQRLEEARNAEQQAFEHYSRCGEDNEATACRTASAGYDMAIDELRRSLKGE